MNERTLLLGLSLAAVVVFALALVPLLLDLWSTLSELAEVVG